MTHEPQLDECREAFEKWCLENSYLPVTEEYITGETDYKYPVVKGAWQGWQAAWSARPAQSNAVSDDMAWVIEGDGVYWTGSHCDKRGFTRKHEDALRFARFEDAEKVKHWLLQDLAIGLRTTQHIWIAEQTTGKGENL